MSELPAKVSMDHLKTFQLDKHLSTPIGRRYLSHRVRRYPLDLRAQVQRILVNQGQDQLAGTLQDCFIALEDNGLELRRELFGRVKDELSEENHSYFSNWLSSDFASAYDDRYINGSVLAKGLLEKSEPLLVQQERKSITYESYYQEAIDCLDYGQLDKAQELLEQELINPDGDPRTESELLRVYDYTNDVESKQRLKTLLNALGRELCDDWNSPQQSAK
jgi:hypothetical protein